MLAMSKGGAFLSSGVGVVVPPCVCAAGLVGGGGLLSAGIFPAVRTLGAGVAVASGGDFCGSVCGYAVAAVRAPTSDGNVPRGIGHVRRERTRRRTRSDPG